MKSEVEYLSQLVKFPTVSGDHLSAKTCVDFCASFFERQGMHVKIIKSGEFYNMVATTHRTKSPKVMLQAHMDVVAADDTFFEATEDKDNIVGRGVYDMKFACASYMTLVHTLRESLKNYDLGIMLTFDEEIGGKNGVKFLLDEGYSCEVVILPDGGDNWRLESSANGAWFMRLVADGKSAHGSRPEEGVNAAARLMRVTSKLQQKYAGNASVDGTTCALTGLQSGEAMNQIPDHAEATFDIRYKNKTAYAAIRGSIEDIARDGNVEIVTIDTSAPVELDRDHAAVKHFFSIAEEILGKPLETCHSFGSTDARFFAEKDIPCIVLRPNGGGAHSEGEWIKTSDLALFTKLLMQYVTSYACHEDAPAKQTLDSVHSRSNKQ